jgi:hypothetical protein
MKEIAGLIADLAAEAQPLPGDDAIGVFEMVANSLQNKTTLRNGTLADVLADYVCARLGEFWAALWKKYAVWTERNLADKYRVYKVDSDAEAEVIAEKAVNELREKFEAFPPALLAVADRVMLEQDMKVLRASLLLRIPVVAVERRWFLEDEFRANCLSAAQTVFSEAKARLGWWPKWTRELEEDCVSRFRRAVDYDNVPQEMQRVVGDRYREVRDRTINRVRWEIEWIRFAWVAAIVTIAILCLMVLIKRWQDSPGCQEGLPSAFRFQSLNQETREFLTAGL